VAAAWSQCVLELILVNKSQLISEEKKTGWKEERLRDINLQMFRFTVE
jgi:hypothetical protein